MSIKKKTKHPGQILQAIINQEQEISLSPDRLSDIRVLERKGNTVIFSFKDKIFKAKIWEADHQNKRYLVNIEGFPYEIQLEDQLDMVIQSLGLNQRLKIHLETIMAPMPGMVLEILVKEGEKITMHQKLLVLEAMKMENVIQSAGEGTIEKILVTRGDKVEKGQILIKLK